MRQAVETGAAPGRARRGLAALMLVGCGTVPAPSDAGGADAGAPDGRRCLDDSRYEVCAAGACRTDRCRGDELCRGGACEPWWSAPLACGFELHVGSEVPRQVLVRVDEGGFPRAQVEALRFDFGDGTVGYGETLRHTYESAGVYPVTLDVRLVGFRRCRSRQLAMIDPPSDHDPLRLTVNSVPELLNGSVPLERGRGPEWFTLAVPRRGFTVDIALLERPEDRVSTYTLRAADVDVSERVTFEDGGVRMGTWQVTEDLPVGPLTLSLEGTTESGQTHRRALTVEVRELPAPRNPISEPVLWLFRSDVDVFTTRREALAGGYTLVSEPVPNGEPDLIEELALIGAQGPDPDANTVYRRWITDGVRREVYRTFGVAPDGTPLDGIPIRIVWEDEPGAPSPASFTTDGAFSMMRFGGTFDGFVGFSDISPHYRERVDDSTAERGVATAGLVGILASTPVVSDAIAPLREVPVGAHPRDAEALDPGFDRYARDADPEVLERHEQLRAIARYLALMFASVTAHEMGHAMGLMPNGPPPAGFFGDVRDVPFINPDRTNSWHADLPGLNVMQAGGGDYLALLGEALATIELPRGSADLLRLAEIVVLETRLSAYSRAYLQGRLTYDEVEPDAGGSHVGCRVH